MTCIKTGAVVYFRNYGYLTRCDVYAVMDTFIFRYYPDQGSYQDDDSGATHVVELIDDSDSWFHRSDLGVTVAPSYLVTVQG